MYHLLNPSDVFFRLRPLLKRDGLLLMQSAYAAKEKEAVLRVNCQSEDNHHPTTYFLPSASAIRGLAHLACLDILATRHNSPSRFTLLGRGTVPEEVRGRTDTCKEMHRVNFEDPAFNLRMLEGVPTSRILYRGSCGHEDIDINQFSTQFPTQPIGFDKVLGKNLNKRRPC